MHNNCRSLWGTVWLQPCNHMRDRPWFSFPRMFLSCGSIQNPLSYLFWSLPLVYAEHPLPPNCTLKLVDYLPIPSTASISRQKSKWRTTVTICSSGGDVSDRVERGPMSREDRRRAWRKAGGWNLQATLPFQTIPAVVSLIPDLFGLSCQRQEVYWLALWGELEWSHRGLCGRPAIAQVLNLRDRKEPGSCFESY